MHLDSRIRSILLFPIAIILTSAASAQNTQKDSIPDNYSAYKRGLSFAGLLQPRYTYSLNSNVDVNGKNFDETNKGITNSFSLKRVRFQVRARINDHFDAVILVNFAEFSNITPAGKVLENAYIRYSLNKHLNVIMGQYRPYIGIEDATPVDIIPSLDFSNQYYLFGANGWQSFQAGVCVFGDITGNDSKIPVRYYVGVHNGNGKTQSSDNDNSKHFYTRLDASPSKDLTIGVNGGIGSVQNRTGSMWGADLKGTFSLGGKWKLDLLSEYKNGTNFSDFSSYAATPKPALNQFRMHGFYVMPNFRYEFNNPRLRALEFSSRYEHLDPSSKLNSNMHQTIIPMVGIVFSDNYYAVLQAGIIMEFYHHDIPLTSTYSHNAAVVQFQVRF